MRNWLKANQIHIQSYEKQWIGLEYIPKNGTNEGLKWIEEFGFHL